MDTFIMMVMMMKMISETENITQQHGPDKQKGYTV